MRDNKTKMFFSVPSVAKSNSSISDNSWKVSLTLWGTGKAKREFLYVDDMADACVHVMEKVEAENIYSNDISHINIGCGEDLTISELSKNIKNVTGFNGTVKFDDTKPDGTPRKLLEVNNLGSLGWKFSTDLHTGISNSYNKYLNRN